jgi:hypothetical protein
MEAIETVCDRKFHGLKNFIKMSNEMSSRFDVKLAVKRVDYFQSVCPDFIIVL